MKLNPIGRNQTVVTTVDGQIFFSYSTPVAAILRHAPEGKDEWCTVVRTSHKWSRTTTRHINKWLGNLKAEEMPQSFFDNLGVTR